MRIIGLTGSIACGKSTVSATLAELGAVIIDGDLLSRELTAPGEIALSALHSAFGDAIFFSDGTLDRKALGRVVFQSKNALEQLDSLMQPLIRQLVLERIQQQRNAETAVTVLDMPLLFEKGLDSLCDTVWCVWLPHDLQLLRLMERDKLDRAGAEARIASQLPSDEKAARAQVVIDTSGSIDYTQSIVRKLYQQEIQSLKLQGGQDGTNPDTTASQKN